MSQVDLWELERGLAAQGLGAICGVDEAGRGPLAGPVCAAAVLLPLGVEIPGLNDSKKLSDKKRRELFDVICQKALSFGIAFATEQEIDRINILQATFLAMAGPCPNYLKSRIWFWWMETGNRNWMCRCRRWWEETAKAPALPPHPFWRRLPGMTL